MIATTGEVARALDLGQPSAHESARIELALEAAIEAVRAYTGRSWDIIDDDTEPTARIYAGRARVVLIADVEVADTVVAQSDDQTAWTTVDATLWHLRPLNEPTANRLHLESGEFARFVRVTGRHGVTELPAAVKQATILMAARIYERNNSPSGVTYGGDFGPIRVSRFEDPEVARLLDTVARPGLTFA